MRTIAARISQTQPATHGNVLLPGRIERIEALPRAVADKKGNRASRYCRCARYINQILNLMVGETLAGEWTTYLKFTAALIAYVIFRVFEGRKNAT